MEAFLHAECKKPWRIQSDNRTNRRTIAELLGGRKSDVVRTEIIFLSC